ncbi:MAG: DUF1501 domain-containing protein [Planctomycetes bacterium]|nr:DUF1501 domain-containing protein [Planctomycetota bacterium]
MGHGHRRSARPHACGGRGGYCGDYQVWRPGHPEFSPSGGGVKGGFSYGATDNFGCTAVEGRMHVHDLHATILHLMGLDHEKLTYRYSGRDFRLTDVAGNVVRDLIA